MGFLFAKAHTVESYLKNSFETLSYYSCIRITPIAGASKWNHLFHLGQGIWWCRHLDPRHDSTLRVEFAKHVFSVQKKSAQQKDSGSGKLRCFFSHGWVENIWLSKSGLFFFLRNKRSADHPSLRGIRKLWLVFSWLYIPLKKMCKGKKQLQTNQVYSKYHRKKKNKVKGEIHKAKDELVNWDVYSEKLP